MERNPLGVNFKNKPNQIWGPNFDAWKLIHFSYPPTPSYTPLTHTHTTPQYTPHATWEKQQSPNQGRIHHPPPMYFQAFQEPQASPNFSSHLWHLAVSLPENHWGRQSDYMRNSFQKFVATNSFLFLTPALWTVRRNLALFIDLLLKVLKIVNEANLALVWLFWSGLGKNQNHVGSQIKQCTHILTSGDPVREITVLGFNSHWEG